MRLNSVAIKIVALWIGISFLGSCISLKQVTYFQRSDSSGDTLAMIPRFVRTIHPGDILSVQVSSLNAEASAFFNPYTTTESDQPQHSSAPTLPATKGYLIDNSGAIRLPLIGKVKLLDMNVIQASDCIQAELLPYLKEPTVNVRFLNFRISVLGEVTHPALFMIQNDQITLPEALSMAGDITNYGRRTNVMIIREVNGHQVFNRVDLTKRDVFRSPFYYLQPNDIVYVEPRQARVANANHFYMIMPTIIGILLLTSIIARGY